MKSICKNSNRWRKYRAASNFRGCRLTSLRSRIGTEGHSSQPGTLFRPNNWKELSQFLAQMQSQLSLTIKRWEQRELEFLCPHLPEAGLARAPRRYHLAVRWARSQRKWMSRRNKSLPNLNHSTRNSLSPRSWRWVLYDDPRPTGEAKTGILSGLAVKEARLHTDFSNLRDCSLLSIPQRFSQTLQWKWTSRLQQCPKIKNWRSIFSPRRWKPMPRLCHLLIDLRRRRKALLWWRLEGAWSSKEPQKQVISPTGKLLIRLVRSLLNMGQNQWLSKPFDLENNVRFHLLGIMSTWYLPELHGWWVPGQIQKSFKVWQESSEKTMK